MISKKDQDREKERVKRRWRKRLGLDKKEEPKRKPGRGVPRKVIAGVAVAVAVFAGVAGIFTLQGWPTNLANLGFTLGVAWLVGLAAGGHVTQSKPAIIAPTALAIALAAGTLVAGVPWKIETPWGG